MICRDCGGEHTLIMPSGKESPVCANCAWELLAKLPNPDCKICGGSGEYRPQWRGGKLADCGCSILDDIVGRI
jgi:hypothetical protein